MLVLSRKVGEKILVGDGIAIQVVEIGFNRVRLGIVAPSDIVILREELKYPEKGGGRNYGSVPPDMGERSGRDVPMPSVLPELREPGRNPEA